MVVGKTIRELRNVRERLAKLREHAKGLGDSFSTVAHHLQNDIEFFQLEGESTDTRFVKPRQYDEFHRKEPHIPKIDELEIKAVLALRDEVRVCVLEEKRLVESLEKMGLGERRYFDPA
jgi:hypothetical protein